MPQKILEKYFARISEPIKAARFIPHLMEDTAGVRGGRAGQAE
jgi:hypothetical protein